jgi:4-amino-4-deoxy-L-arabinose transferase-like glycosyltransferase
VTVVRAEPRPAAPSRTTPDAPAADLERGTPRIERGSVTQGRGRWWGSDVRLARPDIALSLAATALAAGLRFYRLGDTGQNLFYAAAVRSMLDSWHNFFFVSFDPGGALAVDKPPLGLWLQAGAASAFGVHYWALALPQAIAGTLAAPVLYWMVRSYGRLRAFIAAVVLAALPVSVASARNNSLDTVTMLLMLLAAWAILRYRDRHRFRWLACSAILAGLAFNTKMFEAFVPLPAFALVYGLDMRRKIIAHRWSLVGAATVLGVVSLCWVVVVGLTPSGDRPVVYNGYGNSIWSLTFRFNGLNHVVSTGLQERVRSPDDSTVGLGEASGTPPQRPWRLLTGTMGGELGWFLPVALFESVVFLRRRRPQDVLWASWLLTGFILFSFSGDARPQYLEAMAAPLAVCAGVGLGDLGASLKQRRPRAVATAVLLIAFACSILWTTDDTVGFSALAAILGCLGALCLVATSRVNSSRIGLLGVATLLVGLSVGPLAWAVETAAVPQMGSAARYPAAGPEDARDYPPALGGDQPGPAQLSTDPVLPFLLAHTANNRYLVLTERALYGNAPRYVLITNRPVLTLDSFSTEQSARSALEELVASNQLRYVGPWMDPSLSLGQWFLGNCRDLANDGLLPLGSPHLYDCKATADGRG